MKNTYKTVHGFGYDEIIIKKSKFIGYTKSIDKEEEAHEFIKEISEKHRDASHNVYAYVVGENSNIQRYNDDGEPSGTAGIPVLEVIKKEELRNVVVVVTRYFGGIKLGGGGLIRAYTKGAKIGIVAGKIVDKVLHKRVKIRAQYTLYGKIENELLRKNFEIVEVTYDDAVSIVALSDFDRVEILQSMVVEITSGNAEIDIIGEEYFSVVDGKILKD